jgi:hypothetical protein
MTDTARDIISEALLDLGVLAEGEQPTAIQAAGALKKLNGMLELWSLDNLLIYGMTRNQLSLVGGQGTYTIGTGGNLNIPRPNQILSAYVYDTTLPLTQRADYPLRIYNNQEWADQTFKDWQANFPIFGIYFDDKYPLITAYVNQVPTSSQYAIAIYTSDILSNLTIDQVLSFPAGYRTLIVSNLAIELSGSYQVEVPQSVQLAATKSMRLIGNKNVQINELRTPYDSFYYDMNSNQFRRSGA